jgi:glycosyltransferase involved in cell wall biosynthesis
MAVTSQSIDIHFIIPVHNAAGTLASCIQSIIKGSGDCRILITVVDDASTDNIETVLVPLRNKLKINLLRLPTNCGAGAARNAAIAIGVDAKATMFIDADDTIISNSITKLYKILSDTGCDFVVGTYWLKEVDAWWVQKSVYQHDDTIWKLVTHGRSSAELTREDIALLSRQANYPWNKIYNTHFLNKARIRFGESFCHNDVLAHWISFARAARVVCVDVPLVLHRIGNAASITSANDRRRFDLYAAMDSVESELGGEFTAELRRSWIFFQSKVLDWAYYKISEDLREDFVLRAHKTIRAAIRNLDTRDDVGIAARESVTNMRYRICQS